MASLDAFIGSNAALVANVPITVVLTYHAHASLGAHRAPPPFRPWMWQISATARPPARVCGSLFARRNLALLVVEGAHVA